MCKENNGRVERQADRQTDLQKVQDVKTVGLVVPILQKAHLMAYTEYHFYIDASLLLKLMYIALWLKKPLRLPKYVIE